MESNRSQTSASAYPRETIRWWPEAAQRLGLGRSTAYAIAAKDPSTIPGLIRVGGRWLVLRRPFERALRGE